MRASAIGLVVGCFEPPSGSTLTATAATSVADSGSRTTVAPSACGRKVLDGDIVLELLRSNDVDYTLDVFRINIKSGEAVPVRKALHGGDLWFVGVKDGQYVYIEKARKLVIQSSEAQALVPVVSKPD